MADFYLKNSYIVKSLTMFGFMFFDTLDDALLCAARLKALGYPAKIENNPNPEKVAINGK